MIFRAGGMMSLTEAKTRTAIMNKTMEAIEKGELLKKKVKVKIDRKEKKRIQWKKDMVKVEGEEEDIQKMGMKLLRIAMANMHEKGNEEENEEEEKEEEVSSFISDPNISFIEPNEHTQVLHELSDQLDQDDDDIEFRISKLDKLIEENQSEIIVLENDISTLEEEDKNQGDEQQEEVFTHPFVISPKRITQQTPKKKSSTRSTSFLSSPKLLRPKSALFTTRKRSPSTRPRSAVPSSVSKRSTSKTDHPPTTKKTARKSHPNPTRTKRSKKHSSKKSLSSFLSAKFSLGSKGKAQLEEELKILKKQFSKSDPFEAGSFSKRRYSRGPKVNHKDYLHHLTRKSKKTAKPNHRTAVMTLNTPSVFDRLTPRYPHLPSSPKKSKTLKETTRLFTPVSPKRQDNDIQSPTLKQSSPFFKSRRIVPSSK
mmetsp:Transcript_12613/g.18911  ORF Transcript_12613/g.18911 Transcript_12613/m.18911 type:complete len:425 (+) Transcript_12613:2801-4075(+)